MYFNAKNFESQVDSTSHIFIDRRRKVAHTQTTCPSFLCTYEGFSFWIGFSVMNDSRSQMMTEKFSVIFCLLRAVTDVQGFWIFFTHSNCDGIVTECSFGKWIGGICNCRTSISSLSEVCSAFLFTIYHTSPVNSRMLGDPAIRVSGFLISSRASSQTTLCSSRLGCGQLAILVEASSITGG